MISLLKSKSDFFNRRALYVSADKLSVYHWEKGELGSSYLFDTDQSGRDNFKRYLQESVNTPMHIVIDIIEEEFRQDTIPHVFGADREALILRKRSRLFRDASYFYTQSQGREEGGRRDDRLLFMAINNKEILEPWITLLEEFKVPLSGIISIPLLLQSYIKTLPDVSEHALFVTLQSISGLRQTYFQNHELQISRLSRLPRFGTASYAPKIISEVDKIQRYLNSLRLIPTDSSLDVYIVGDQKSIDELKDQSIASPMVRRNYLQLDKLLGINARDGAKDTPFCDHLLMHHLLKHKLKNCYAEKREMRYLKMRNIRHAMNFMSVILMLFSLIYGSFNFMSGLSYKQESEASKNKAAFYKSRYDLARERLPKTPVDPAQVKVAVEAVSTLDEYKSTPYEMLVYLGKGLEQFPNIKLDNLAWRYSLDEKGDSGKKKRKKKKRKSDLPEDSAEIKYYQISNIKAHIEPFDGNYREAIAIVNAFAETLRSFESTRSVSIESFPLDISSSAKLQGDSDSIGKEALFSLKAVIGVN